MNSDFSIALLNPLGDFGINQYSHELAEAIGQNGVRVGFDTESVKELRTCRHHQRWPVLNSSLWKHLARARSGAHAEIPHSAEWASEALDAAPLADVLAGANDIPKSKFRKWFLTAELIVHLRSRGYDAIWTQWP